MMNLNGIVPGVDPLDIDPADLIHFCDMEGDTNHASNAEDHNGSPKRVSSERVG
jgi:hypothetical protein